MDHRDALSILQICSASEAVYGAAQSLMTLAHGQRARGDRVGFVTFKGKRFGSQVRHAGFSVNEVRVRTKIDPLAILRMRKVIRNGRYQVVHTHLSTSSVNGCLAARFAGVPGIATVHGMSGKLSFAFADHLIAVSQNVKSHLIAQGVDHTKITVVYNGLGFADNSYSADDARRNFELSGSPIVGTVARVTQQKGIEYGIEAVALMLDEFPHIRYVVAGDGDALQACRQKAQELGVERHVTFLGYQKDVGSVLAALDLFLFPSLKEAMGIALVEAMAAKLPVVATTVGGIPEVVSPDCGVLVPPRSASALADAAAGLLRQDLKRTAMGEAARRRSDEVFGVEAMVKGVDHVYRTILQGSAHVLATSSDETGAKRSARPIP